MNRITDKHLQGKVDTINRYLGFDPDNLPFSTPGSITLAGAYGGTGVHRYVNDLGGVSDLFYGYGTKREVSHFLDGMMQTLRILDKSMTV